LSQLIAPPGYGYYAFYQASAVRNKEIKKAASVTMKQKERKPFRVEENIHVDSSCSVVWRGDTVADS
jgi:hypothetical protein